MADDYRAANVKCHASSGNAKSVGLKEARTLEVTAKDLTQDPRKDAVGDKNTVAIAHAKANCDVLAGVTKDNSMSDANLNFGK